MIPITRKELYLNKIVGNDDYSVPEKPISEEEFFFAEILGEAVQAPEPLTRYQMYLAKIAGRNIEIPYPEVRLEYFLARAAGMEIEALTPITREEMFWADYALIVEKELSDIPPLTFNAVAGTLKNYRIYGNTVDGESVGGRTANLFANLWKKGYIRADNGREDQTDEFICSGFFPVEYGQTYSISRNINVGYDNVRGYRDDGSFIGAGTDVCDVGNPFPSGSTNIGVFTVTNENVAFIRFNDSANDLGMKYMIVKGTYTKQTMPDYEPYGYKVPVTAEGKNLLQNTATSRTITGVTFTVNSDRSVTCYGTATATTFFTISMTINQGTYTVSGAPAGCNFETPYVTIRLRTPSGGGDVPPFNNNDFGTGVTISSNKNNNNDYLYKIRVPKDYTCNNITFYPMIRKAGIEDGTYEPYHAPVTTPIYLPEPIKMVGDEAEYIDYGEQKFHRISGADLDVTLPALPTLPGTNVLSVGTAVQPSNVYIKYKGAR